MEILRKLQASQNAFEDTLRLEINYEEIKDTKEGKRILSWTRRRRKVVDRVCKILKKF
jgi:hypothetical protein